MEGTRLPIKFGMKRNMFSYAPSFSACAGRTAAPLPLACVCTDAMVVEMASDPSSRLSSMETVSIAACLCIHVYPAALTAESGGSYARCCLCSER